MSSDNAAEQWKLIDVHGAQEKLQAGGAVAIDVRMPFDYAGGRIQGAVNLPGESLRFRKASVPEDKELLIFSEDGNTSAKVCALALSLGYKDVYNVEGGMEAWRSAEYELETIDEGASSRPPSQG